MISISRELLVNEVKSAKDVLAKWETQLQTLPHLDVPGSEEDLQSVMQTFIAEMLLISAKCNSISSILAGEHP